MRTIKKRIAITKGPTQLAKEAAEATRDAVLAAFYAGVEIGERRKKEDLINYEELIEILRTEADRTSQRKLAMTHGLTPQQLNPVLKGKKPISAEMASKLGFDELRVYVKRKKKDC